MGQEPEDDGVPARVQWDWRPFRITQIPEDLDQECLLNVIEQLFKLRRQEFKVHSLASDASDQRELRWRTATVSFCSRPRHLHHSLAESDQWRFALPSTLLHDFKSLNEPVYIYFDTHFRGFTPLSSIDFDEEHKIEYATSRNFSSLLLIWAAVFWCMVLEVMRWPHSDPLQAHTHGREIRSQSIFLN